MDFPLRDDLILADWVESEDDAEMLWVSVHDSIDGIKLRRLYKTLKCSKNEAMGILVFLWLWGLSNAERSGEIPYAERDDIADVIAKKLNGSDLEPDDIVVGLIESGWLEEKDGGIYFHDWEDWQKPYYDYLDRKKRSAEAMRAKREEERKAEEKEDKQRDDYPDDFKRIWDKYPRKVNKGLAFKKYKARLKSGWTVQELETAVDKYSDECKRKHTEIEYIKHMATFFSDAEPFTDYIPKNAVEGKKASVYDYNPFE